MRPTELYPRSRSPRAGRRRATHVVERRRSKDSRWGAICSCRQHRWLAVSAKCRRWSSGCVRRVSGSSRWPARLVSARRAWLVVLGWAGYELWSDKPVSRGAAAGSVAAQPD